MKIRPKVTRVEIGGEVLHFRSMSGYHRERYIGMSEGGGKMKPLHAGWAINWCLCDAEGNHVHRDDDEQAALETCMNDWDVVDALYIAAMKASGMDVDAIERAEGNSEAGNVASGS